MKNNFGISFLIIGTLVNHPDELIGINPKSVIVIGEELTHGKDIFIPDKNMLEFVCNRFDRFTIFKNAVYYPHYCVGGITFNRNELPESFHTKRAETRHL